MVSYNFVSVGTLPFSALKMETACFFFSKRWYAPKSFNPEEDRLHQCENLEFFIFEFFLCVDQQETT